MEITDNSVRITREMANLPPLKYDQVTRALVEAKKEFDNTVPNEDCVTSDQDLDGSFEIKVTSREKMFAVRRHIANLLAEKTLEMLQGRQR